MRKQFTVTLDLGNSAMKGAHDIIHALEGVIVQLEERVDQELKPFHSCAIMDTNGNSVGAWNIEERR